MDEGQRDTHVWGQLVLLLESPKDGIIESVNLISRHLILVEQIDGIDS